MPKVHTASATSMLDLIDINLVLEWENYKHGKLLALPFSNETDNADNHSHIGECLLTAASEITESENLRISIPIPSEEATRNGATPTSFLIYNLSDTDIYTLVQQGVWSSPVITFRVAELHPPSLDFLFTIKGFVTHNESIILKMIQNTWQSKATESLINEVIDTFMEDSHP